MLTWTCHAVRAAPAGGIILPDSPNSLIERGHKEKGREILEKIRGTSEVDAGARKRSSGALFCSSVACCGGMCTLQRQPAFLSRRLRAGCFHPCSLLRPSPLFPPLAEYNDILEAAQSAAQVSELQAWKNLAKREYR